MTYKDLLKELNNLTAEQLNQNVTVYLADQDDFVAVTTVSTTQETDVLDKEHFVLISGNI